MQRSPLATRPRGVVAALLAGSVLAGLAGCADPSGLAGPIRPGVDQHTVPSAAPLAAVTSTFTLVGAADIASCGSNQGDEKTAAIINNLLLSDPTATVFAAGDVVYDNATAAEFTNCYRPSWGRFKAKTRPAPGNHEYNVTPTPYFNYFGSAAGNPSKGYYSYDLGTWHIVVLNSNLATKAGSAQNAWLVADLAATSNPCILAYWHHARFASAVNSSTPVNYKFVRPFWEALYAARADVVLVGHQHFYERFAPMRPDGTLDAENGLRQFVVGTGGKSAGGSFQATAHNSQVKNIGTFGVLKLTLGASSYRWQFLPVAGKSFTDTGGGECHDD